MSQLIINDLTFCESEFSRLDDIKVSGGFFKVDFKVDSASAIDLAGEGAAGYGLAIAIGIGGSPSTSTNISILKLFG
ncbi:hypothetical protein VB715_21085 [Crocosphaera sp. UHCC 0190]|uniref:hypothetical protein n=1 Tax=Crocosphaera sp. UHCC 0190 TaxID=3110246 RepID=UPI002B205AB9|nr:hypothetical protein [Crocosphaera sp. UHCC 0190]MEA5512270.1 hypothetical protein [Crocosphaera sp. UHCC 0190]